MVGSKRRRSKTATTTQSMTDSSHHHNATYNQPLQSVIKTAVLNLDFSTITAPANGVATNHGLGVDCQNLARAALPPWV
ncbi:hypothetical protein L3X38_026969 [Prunus dulcis]|uniref:Uncharacterized protein n=1 Tax=Prunus dulcis TaxID=3755 RepID=A0AAD4VM64_PRUDU|nr:hypothetical protein L3X38_026969 [Prunus dulcis]